MVLGGLPAPRADINDVASPVGGTVGAWGVTFSCRSAGFAQAPEGCCGFFGA